MSNKKSFILHNDSLLIEEKLSDEQLGKLFRAIIKFQDGIEIDLPFEIELAFFAFKNQFIRDSEKHDEFCEQQRNRAKKRWNTNGKNTIPNRTENTDGINGINKNTENANNDSKNKNDSKKEKEPLLKKASKTHTPLQETIEDFKKHRKQMKAPMTDRAVLLLYKDLDKLASTDEEKILILEQSIFKGWKGVFQLKEEFIQEKEIDFEKERLLKRGEWADMMAEREKRGEPTDNNFDQWLFDNNLKHLTREGTYNEF